MYGLDGYVPPDARMGFLTVSVLKLDISFALAGVVYPMWSLFCVTLFYQPKFRCENAQLHGKQIIC